MPAFAVAALYRFVRVPDPAALREPLLQAMRDGEICGSLLLADEGINGTIAGPPVALRGFVDHLRSPDFYDGRFVDLDVKWSTADHKPFRKTKVRLKKEIVTLGQPDIDPQTTVGTYVEPEDWNALIDDPDVTLIDTRNDYEVQIGTFETAAGPAVNPQTATFRDLPAYVEQHLDPAKHKKVAMFCTGGIRCEKSTAYLKSKGFDEVYHLRGGILKYLEQVPESESRWRGECFVFDRRVSVGHGLAPGTHELCHACGWPIAADETSHPDYLKGVSCPRCVDQHTPEQRERFAQRQRQFDQHQIA